LNKYWPRPHNYWPRPHNYWHFVLRF